MKIAEGVAMLELSAPVPGSSRTVNPTLIWDEDMAILVDTGYPGQADMIRKEIAKAEVPLAQVAEVIITHHDMDHIGSLSALSREIPQKVQVLAHEGEKPFVQGEKTAIKLAQLEERLDSLSAEMEERYKILKNAYKNLTVAVDKCLADGEGLPYCGGIKVIHTPGHTPGHICLYLEEQKILIAGDALNVADGRLVGPNPEYTFDLDLAVKSLQKLLNYDIQKVICYHGGLYEDNPNRRIAALAKGNLNDQE
ncbi:MAG: MBL fold metallo-hydrolase [Peptococcaceae bacterium]